MTAQRKSSKAATPVPEETQAIKVYVSQGADESVYFTSEVKWHQSADPKSGGQVFLAFKPTNGYDVGRLHCVPIERVLRIVNGGAA